MSALAAALFLLGAMDAREGSGTSWRPDDAPMYAVHQMPGDWMVMLHWSALAGYDDQWSDQGSRRFTSVNWAMGMAYHSLLGGDVELRSMVSLEPLTAGGPTQLPRYGTRMPTGLFVYVGLQPPLMQMHHMHMEEQ